MNHKIQPWTVLALTKLDPFKPFKSLCKEISRAAGAGGCTLDLGLANRGLEWEVSVPQFPPQ